MQEVQDTEVTLGTGRLLALFFALVVVCALFFSVGFSLGRKSVPQQAAQSAAAPVPSPIVTTGEMKPTALKGEAKGDCATPENCPQPAAAASTSDELTFYKAVDQPDAKPQLEKPEPAPKVTEASPVEQKPAPEMAKMASLGTGYMVQVAAVSKSDDAEALVNALRKKSYPVFSTSMPTDKLYHVQVGPFADIKDAEAMKVKLVGDGYNPIVKK